MKKQHREFYEKLSGKHQLAHIEHVRLQIILLYPKIEDWAWFVDRVKLICFLIMSNISRMNPNFHLLSVDEKTGIQALERYEQRGPKVKGLENEKNTNMYATAQAR